MVQRHTNVIVPIALYCLSFALPCGVTVSAAEAASAPFTVTVIGGDYIPGPATANAINKWGQVVGAGSGDSGGSPPHALIWTPTVPNGTTGSLHDLQTDPSFTPGSASSNATAINDFGEVVGSAYTPGQGDGNQSQSWLWRPSPLNSTTGVLNGTTGTAVTFPLLTIPSLGTSSEHLSGINNLGQIVGYGIYYHLVTWIPTKRRGLTGSWTYEPVYSSVPAGINDAGQIAGGTSQAIISYPYIHKGALPLTAGDLVDSTLWDHTAYESAGGATGLNAAGNLAITAVNASPRQIRAYMRHNGTVIDISAGGAMTNTAGINRYNEVVGTGYDAHSTVTAYLYSTGIDYDLNTLIPAAPSPASWRLSGCGSVNDAGQLLCHGNYNTGSGIYGFNANFLLTPAAQNVTSQVHVVLDPVTPSGSRFSQVAHLTNNGADLAGPVDLVLDGLPGSVKLVGGAVTHFAGPVGSHYVTAIAAGGLFGAGSSTTIAMKFTAPSAASVTYVPRVLADDAAR